MRYWTGFFSGASGFVVLALFLFGVSSSANMAAVYADLGTKLSMATTLVLHPAWRYGVPVLGALLVAGLNLHSAITERRRTMFLGGVTAALLMTTFFTLWAHYAPIFELSGNISAQ